MDRNDVASSAEDGTMERRGAGPIAETDEAPVRIEERLDRFDVSVFRGGVNRMVGRLRKRPSETVACLFQDSRDRLVATISGHYDQAAVVQSVPLWIGARVEQQADGLDVSFACGEMNGRRVPVFGATQSRIAFKQPAQRRDVAGRCRDERVPRVVAGARFEFKGSDHRAPAVSSP